MKTLAMQYLVVTLPLFYWTVGVEAFTVESPRLSHFSLSRRNRCLKSAASSAGAVKSDISYNPLFDFSEVETVEKFDRIDDVIMVSKCPW